MFEAFIGPGLNRHPWLLARMRRLFVPASRELLRAWGLSVGSGQLYRATHQMKD